MGGADIVWMYKSVYLNMYDEGTYVIGLTLTHHRVNPITHVYVCVHPASASIFQMALTISDDVGGRIMMNIYICVHNYACVYVRTYVCVRAYPTCWIHIHVFLWRNHKNMNTVFRLVNPVYDMDKYIFKVDGFT